MNNPLKSLFSAAISASFCMSCTSVHAEQPVIHRNVPLPLPGACNFNRLLSGPSGAVAIYANPEGNLTGPAEPDVAIAGAKLLVIQVGRQDFLASTLHQSLEVAGWMKDGSLVVRTAKSKLFRISASEVTVLPVNVTQSVRLEPSRVVGELGSATPQKGDIRTVLFTGLQNAPRLRVDEDAGVLMAQGGSSIPRLAIGMSDTRMYAGSANPGWTYVGDRSSRNVGPYSLPVIDQLSGKKVGAFAPRHLDLDDNDAERAFLAALPADAAILDFSIAGSMAAGLIESADGSRTALVINEKGHVASKKLCNPLSPFPAASNTMLEVVEFPTVHSDAAPPVGVLRRVSKKRTCLTIYYHGGPELSARTLGFSDLYSRLHGSGCDLLRIDYSGSAGGGYALSAQVRKMGYAAFATDAKSIRAWLDQHRYPHVSIVGTSFGTAPALAAKALLGEAAKLFLVVPMTTVRGAGQEQETAANLGTGSHFLRKRHTSAFDAFQATFYGPGNAADRFDSDLAQAYSAASANAEIFAAANDRKAPLDDIRRLAPHAKIHAVSGGHEVVGSMQVVWDAISRATEQRELRD